MHSVRTQARMLILAAVHEHDTLALLDSVHTSDTAQRLRPCHIKPP
jgi:alpha-L-fucosidase